ncbi:MAG: magnesium transporter [Caulobacterales bacterium]
MTDPYEPRDLLESQPNAEMPRPAEKSSGKSPVIDGHYVATVIGAVGDKDWPLLRRLVLGMHAADAAELFGQLPPLVFDSVLQFLGSDLSGEVLAELPDQLRERAMEVLPATTVAKALAQLDSDDAALLVDDLDEEKRDSVLAAVPDVERAVLQESLAFEEETAGRLMQREFVAAPEFWTVGQTIDHMRAAHEDLPDLFFEVYVVDPGFRPVGAVSLAALLRSARETRLTDLVQPVQALINPDMDQEEAAFLFAKYHLISAPVVDAGGRLKGMLTVDDIVDVIEAENKEDMLALAGVSEAQLSDNIFRSVRARAPWLLLNLVTGVLASISIAVFQGTIEKVVALAVIMPIVSAVGGNAGTQALAVAVRALAARELTPMNAARIVTREALTGVVNGLVIAVALGTVASIWFNDWRLAYVSGLAVLINLTCAGLAGVLAPLTLQRMGADPAVSSSIFVTFVTDFVGFMAFLGIATIVFA